MGTKTNNVIRHVSFLGFEMGYTHRHGHDVDDKTINEMFNNAVQKKRIPLQHMVKKRAIDIMLIGFCTAMEGSDVAFYTQCRIFNNLAGLNYDEDELTTLHMQSVRLYAWKNQL